MSGDYSRDTFDALRDHAATLLQQGRPVTDADWNEMVDTFKRRIRTGTVDTIGRAVVPRETLTGFEMQPAAGGLGIGRGRMYLSGMLMECHGRADFTGPGAPAPVLDRARLTAGRPTGVLDEMISPATGDFLPYAQQPYWPTPTALPTGGRHLAYLVGWEREVTALQNPALLEPALGGIDSTTRIQNVWQVRLAATAAGATCASTNAALGIPGWPDEIAPSSARLSTDTIAIDDPEDPCLVPPTDGYTGIENQFYRVELHTVGANQAAARFKFSRENASVAAAVEAITASNNRLTVSRIGRDRLLAFREDDWVEITDDRRELDHRSGEMLRVAVVHEATREIEFESAVPADLIPAGGSDTFASRHTRIIRWDQRGVIRREDGTAWTDLDAGTSDGLIPVPPAGTRLILESGIVVGFDTQAGPGRFREMDYWRFAARTAGTDIERLHRAPPDGIHRHYARLAILDLPATVVSDCRVFWPPEIAPSEGDCCFCTFCVSAESHNSGTLTIQAAIDQLPDEGGSVCLEAGTYELAEPVRIASRFAVALHGQGALTVLDYTGPGGAIEVRGSVDVTIDRLSILARPRDGNEGPFPPAGIHLINTAFVALDRIFVLALGGPDLGAFGIGLAGLAIGTRIDDCMAVAPVALGAYTNPTADSFPNFLIAAETAVQDCLLLGAREGIRFDGLAMNLAAAQFLRNLVIGIGTGARVAWLEAPGGTTEIDASTFLAAEADGLVLSCGNGRVQDNDISGGERDGHGLRLIPGLVPERLGDVQVIGNRIRDLAGAGLMVEADLESLLVKRNVIRRCATAGIAFAPDAAVRWLAIDNNVISEIARTERLGFGIVAFRVLAGRIAGNSIADIGPPGDGDGNYAGIALLGTGAVVIEGNHIATVGPAIVGQPSSGILVRVPLGALAVRGNQINGHPPSDFGGGWSAIEIGRALTANAQTQPELRPNIAHVPVFEAFDQGPIFAPMDAENAFMVSPGKAGAINLRTEVQITVAANQIHHAGPALRPLIGVMDTSRGSVILSENHCRHAIPSEAFAMVFIEAGRIVAANNVLRRSTEHPSTVLSVGRQGAATVLGNITFGAIHLVPLGLNPPFNALNLIAP